MFSITRVCLAAYHQIGREGPRSRTLLEVICQLIKEPLFNVLRTQEQLGTCTRRYLIAAGEPLPASILTFMQDTSYMEE